MLRTRETSEGGFTIVETAMAGMLAVIVVVGLAGSMAVGLRQARENRIQQTATAVALTEMEAVRALEWDQLAMASIDDDAPLLAASGIQVDGDRAGLADDEVLIVDEDGAVEPAAIETADGVTYTIWRYVTVLGYHSRRFIVEITWNIESGAHSHLSSTLITRATAEQLVVGGG